VRVLAAVLLVAIAAAPLQASAQAGQAVYRSPDGSWSISYPSSWEVGSSSGGSAVAFLAPAVSAGGSRFRPSLVVSVSRLEAGVPAARVLEVARTAFERGVRGATLLGQETLRASDGGPVNVLYYFSPGERRLPGLYFVVGVVVRQRLYTMIGTTSTVLPDYRQQAARFRAVMSTLRAR
jgi:hypothetical protein